MKYFKNDKGILYNGDALTVLKTLSDSYIDCVVTSPPYWALRDYDVDGQIGLELTFQEYLEKLWSIFSEIHRILKPSGTCWVVMGDTYAGSGKGAGYKGNPKESWKFDKKPKIKEKLPSKCLCMIPERFAIGMIERGWVLRNQIIWHKPNAMPSSVKDRFTVDYEKIFFFVKQKKYYFKQILEPTQAKVVEKRMLENKRENYKNNKHKHIQPTRTTVRNKRTVWSINTRPLKEAHYAPFPEELVRTCIDAGCPIDGVVLDPFMGSGTTALVAESMKRKWIGIEINPEYCNITVQRLTSN